MRHDGSYYAARPAHAGVVVDDCPSDEAIFIESMGVHVRLSAIFTRGDERANDFMERNPDHGVIAVLGPLVLIAPNARNT